MLKRIDDMLAFIFREEQMIFKPRLNFPSQNFRTSIRENLALSDFNRKKWFHSSCGFQFETNLSNLVLPSLGF